MTSVSARTRAFAHALLLSAGVALSARAAGAQSTLTFEDLCYHNDPLCAFVAPNVLFSGGPLVSSYASFSWTNFRALDVLNYPLTRPDPDPTTSGAAGYQVASPTYGNVLGLAVGNVVVQRPVGNAFGQFMFSDLAIGSGWTNGMTVGVTGQLDGQTVFSLPNLALSAMQSSQLVLPNLWVDALIFTADFTPAGYTDPYHSAEQQTGRSIAAGGTPYMTYWFDNVTYQVRSPAVVATPEPATLTLLAGGLAVLGGAVMRRRRRN